MALENFSLKKNLFQKKVYQKSKLFCKKFEQNLVQVIK
jgi:hypothetical protein